MLSELGYEFRTQKPIGSYIIDILLPNKFILEVDGSFHSTLDRKGYDMIRTSFLEGRGFKVIRITNCQVSSPSAKQTLLRLLDGVPKRFHRKRHGVRHSKRNPAAQ